MAKKKKGFDIGAFMDQESLELLMQKGEESVAPSEEEVKIVKDSDGDMKMISVSELSEYHNHTYKVLDNEDMAALTDSIKDMGIILPLLVKKSKGGYEVISGHRRLFAAKKLGLSEVPCKVLTVDDATADIMMVDTNLHREEISPSEKARSYDLRIKAMKKKGGPESESNITEQLAQELKSSRQNVNRYRKLLKLSPALLEMVDKKEISVNAGAALAEIPMDEQKHVVEAIEEKTQPITIDIAEKLATASRNGLTKDKVLAIFGGEFKPRKKRGPSEPTGIKEKNIKSFYPASVKKLPGKDKEAFIADCIKAYLESHDSWNGLDLN